MATLTVGSVLAALPTDADAVAVRAGRRSVIGVAPDDVVTASGEAALARLDRLSPGWWVGFAAYDLGRAVERIVPRPRREPDAIPDLGDLVLARFAARAVIAPTGDVEIVGRGAARRMLEDAVASPGVPSRNPTPRPWTSSLDREEFEAGVEAILGHIRAGDCYQVNLTRRLTTGPLDPVALFAALEEHNPAPHAGLLRFGKLAVVSASPECFLRWNGRAIETRPIKGTATDPAWLRASAKDRAENVMIVDLARNDLGRVCESGSIHVPSLCAVEAHPGLHHLVSTVQGRLRARVGLGARLRATLPPASVTGAPKPRVMQIIEDLEPVRRGVYCGAVGWIDTERDRGELAVAIRTFTVTADATSLGVGAGIVADSRPDAEWAETELKAARLLAAAGRPAPEVAALAS